MGALIIRALYFGVSIKAPDFWKLADGSASGYSHPSDISGPNAQLADRVCVRDLNGSIDNKDNLLRCPTFSYRSQSAHER